MSPTTAITLFYRQIIETQGLPFELRVPNAATQRAMHDARSGRTVVKAVYMDELLAKLDARSRKRPVRSPKRRLRGAR